LKDEIDMAKLVIRLQRSEPFFIVSNAASVARQGGIFQRR
jgi:hypothetical protein